MGVSLLIGTAKGAIVLRADAERRRWERSALQHRGWIVTAFSIAYMLSNPLWGGILDRWGIRLGMMVAVTLWTIASTSHAFATTMLGFAVARAALGFGEGATFPGGLRTAVQTLPPEKRARGIAVAYSGGSLGAIVTPPIVRQIVSWWHWRAAFLFTGLIGGARGSRRCRA